MYIIINKMEVKKLLKGFCIGFPLIILSSCGGGIENSEVIGGFYSVVVVLNSVRPSTLQSDVIIKLDANGDGICDEISFQDDFVVFQMTSKPRVKSKDITFSPVYIYKYKLEFLNASTNNNCEKIPVCKEIFTKTYERGLSITLDAPTVTDDEVIEMSKTFQVTVVPAGWKDVLSLYCYTTSDNCVYNVKVTFYGVELYSGKESSIAGTFTVQFADYFQGNSIDEGGNIISIPDAPCIF